MATWLPSASTRSAGTYQRLRSMPAPVASAAARPLTSATLLPQLVPSVFAGLVNLQEVLAQKHALQEDNKVSRCRNLRAAAAVPPCLPGCRLPVAC